MERRNCSACAANKAAHQEFLERYDALRKMFDSHGVTPVLAAQLQRTVCEWLVNHIAKIDTKLRETVPPGDQPAPPGSKCRASQTT